MSWSAWWTCLNQCNKEPRKCVALHFFHRWGFRVLGVGVKGVSEVCGWCGLKELLK